jgi:hypothetical protein
MLKSVTIKTAITHLFVAIITVAACNLLPAGTSAAQELQENIDRPGHDIDNFDLNPPPPNSLIGPVASCQIRCEQRGDCKAWTFVKPGVQGPNARCWLKNAIPTAVANNCCTSGVPVRTFESRIDRPGRDYKNFDLTGADPNLCRAACLTERSNCKAWTYVRPGFQGPQARCWLKTDVPPAFTNSCCTSGVPPIVLH